MVSVTELAQSVDIGPVREIGLLLSNPLVYGALLIILILIVERRKEKILKIMFSLALATLLGMAAKEAFSHDRPCAGEEWCPGGYSFPSTHAVAAFTLMAAFIRRKEYPFYLLFALFVGFSRMNIGVHLFQDVVAALPIAFVAYYITWVVVDDEKGD